MLKDRFEVTPKMNEAQFETDPDLNREIDVAFSKVNNGQIKWHDSGTCFYLGKSEKLEQRIEEHVIKSSLRTYSLKLNLRQYRTKNA